MFQPSILKDMNYLRKHKITSWLDIQQISVKSKKVLETLSTALLIKLLASY